MGKLVAGVAHEINTPVGNALTMASFLSNHARTLEEKVKDRCLDEEDLREFLQDMDESSRLIFKNLTRAADPGLTKPGFNPGEPGIYYPTSTFFRLFNSDDILGLAGAFWAREMGFKKVYFIYEENDFKKNLRQTFW